MENIERITSNIVKKYNTDSPFELCDYLGINVIYQELPDCVRGFFIKILKMLRAKLLLCIFLKKINRCIMKQSLREWKNEAKVVCAHELGHIILHSETNSISLNSRTHLCTSKYEREADLFAVNLLLQDETFSTYEGLSVVEISRITHIPLKLITLKYFPE